MITVSQIDFTRGDHRQIIISLINGYIADEMGGGELLDEKQQMELVEGLMNHPRVVALFAEYDEKPVGIIVAFENFSTFTVRPMFNIHDVFVKADFRGLGVGKALLTGIVDLAKSRNCSRITLEVRHDNVSAQNLYKKFDFHDTEPPMFFWRKYL